MIKRASNTTCLFLLKRKFKGPYVQLRLFSQQIGSKEKFNSKDAGFINDYKSRSFNKRDLTEKNSNIKDRGSGFAAKDQIDQLIGFIKTNRNFVIDGQDDEKIKKNIITVLQNVDYGSWNGKISQLIVLLDKISKLSINNSKTVDKNFTALQMIAKRIVVRCLESFDEFNRIDVLMFLWACFKFNLNDAAVIRNCLKFIENNFNDLSERDISNYIFCLGKSYEEDSGVNGLNEASTLIQSHISKMSPNLVSKISQILLKSQNQQHLTNIIWGISRLKLTQKVFTAQLRVLFIKRNLHFTNSNFRIIVNSLTSLSSEGADDIFEFFLQEFYKRLDTFTLEEITSLITAFYLSKSINLIDMFNTTDEFILMNIKQFTNEQLLSLLIPYTQTFRTHKIIDIILNEVKPSIDNLSIQNSFKLFWGLAILDDDKKIDMSLQLYNRLSKQDYQSFRKIDLCQFAQGLLSLILHYEEHNSTSLQLEEMKRHYEDVRCIIQSDTLMERHEEFTHNDFGVFNMYRTFQEIGFKIVPEFIIDIYNVDFALIDVDAKFVNSAEQSIVSGSLQTGLMKPDQVKIEKLTSLNDFKHAHNRTILIEVDGRSHYIRKTQELLGKTNLKAKHLKKLGYTLISFSEEDCAHISSISDPNDRSLFIVKVVQRVMREQSKNA